MLILGTVICVINYILLWFGAVWVPAGKYAVVYITYLLLGWTFDIMDISLNSLLPVMTAEPKERNSLSLIKMIGYVLGGMAVSIVGPIIVADGSLQSYYALILGAMAIVLVFSIGGVLGVKERVEFKGTENEKYTLKELFGFLASKPVLVTFIASLCITLASYVQSSSNAYFNTYIMGDLALLSGVSAMSMAGMIPAVILSPIVANKIGKKNVFVGGLIVAVAGYVLRLINIKSLSLLYVSQILVSFGTGFTSTLLYGIQADNTTFVQYTTGKRAEAAVASLSSFITKVGQGVAGALPGYILAATGFVANAAAQSQAVNSGIISCVVILPAVFLIVACVIFGKGYTLTREKVIEMTDAIKEDM